MPGAGIRSRGRGVPACTGAGEPPHWGSAAGHSRGHRVVGGCGWAGLHHPTTGVRGSPVPACLPAACTPARRSSCLHPPPQNPTAPGRCRSSPPPGVALFSRPTAPRQRSAATVAARAGRPPWRRWRRGGGWRDGPDREPRAGGTGRRRVGENENVRIGGRCGGRCWARPSRLSLPLARWEPRCCAPPPPP